ncbi:phosphopantetheine-binding protein [Micromonospora cathayae]|uniref:Phosphopantetheine-binding protein n=1 Tax=Micromonospora cathayae TaxID=3028804 RepID=A0ABY7ZT75_9ACTN|nr:phosphopantetheine-binding protein [Micromonospora sp. HUAS 3]WDZ86242.1 phosphopantetheine-binding protein [Micromonospora sp. HUAS 3]
MSQVADVELVPRLTAIWEAELGVPVAPDDDFFDLGGDSLMALVVARQATASGMPMQPGAVLRHPTVAALADAVRRGTA